MTVYFIGAGPGAEDLITVRGLKIIKKCQVCLYAGSLVPKKIISKSPENALIINTSSMYLEEIIDEIKKANDKGLNVARIHSGDPSIYSAITEQICKLNNLHIDWNIIPGVPAFAALAAAIGCELTIPEVAQSIILTRTTMKSSNIPKNEELSKLGRIGTTIIIHLSIRNLRYIKRKLIPYYGENCPVVIAYRVSWPDEKIIFCTLKNIQEEAFKAKFTRTVLILLGPILKNKNYKTSSLYNKNFTHILRN